MCGQQEGRSAFIRGAQFIKPGRFEDLPVIAITNALPKFTAG
jgi:hypothetical protein